MEYDRFNEEFAWTRNNHEEAASVLFPKTKCSPDKIEIVDEDFNVGYMIVDEDWSGNKIRSILISSYFRFSYTFVIQVAQRLLELENRCKGNMNDQVSVQNWVSMAYPPRCASTSPHYHEMEEHKTVYLQHLLKCSQEMQNRRHGNTNEQAPVDVNALTLSLTEELKQLHPVSEERCIYRVAKRLKVLNENVYTPQCVSIGPYHHGKDELKAMEEHKTRYFQHFLGYSKITVDEFVSFVTDNEIRLRNCYQERIDISSERFVRMMLVDAAFVIMVMLRSCSLEFFDQFRNEDELLFNKPWMICDIQNDMILLENQLPFFILDELLFLSNLEVGHFSMVQISSNFLNSLFTSWVVNPYQESNFSESKHLVDFLSIGQQPLEENMHKALDVVNLPSAVELHRAGVKFKRGSSQRLADIKFHDGILEIPLLRITDTTEILFRNLQAFEQSHLYGGEKYFNDYVTMISFIVTNVKDVEILTKKGIIEGLFRGNEQVVHLFRNLSKEIPFDTKRFYFTDVVNGLNKYCNKRRNRWRASFIQNYFYSPWAIISVSAAVYIILLTTIQTVCSVLQVKQQQL